MVTLESVFGYQSYRELIFLFQIGDFVVMKKSNMSLRHGVNLYFIIII
jgi:hypothetical protein